MMSTNFEGLLDTMSLSLSAQSSGKQVIELELDRISSDPDNPRKAFDENQLKELAGSIKERGVIQPITVRPAPEEGRFIIRFGDRRFRAAKAAGLETIPAIVSETGEEGDDLVDQVIENDQRVDLTAAELATAVARLGKAGLKQADIARKLGRPKALISMYASVASMPPLLADLAGSLAIRTVYELHQAWKLDESRVTKLVTARDGQPITTVEARALVKDIEDKAAAADGRLSEQTPEPAATEPVPEAPATRRRKAKGATPELPPLLVEVDGRRGRLVLSGQVAVLFDGAAEAETIDASAIRPAGTGDK